jgi:hypothetical protein
MNWFSVPGSFFPSTTKKKKKLNQEAFQEKGQVYRYASKG